MLFIQFCLLIHVKHKNMVPSQYKRCHLTSVGIPMYQYLFETSWPSHLYNGNHTWKDGLYIEIRVQPPTSFLQCHPSWFLRLFHHPVISRHNQDHNVRYVCSPRPHSWECCVPRGVQECDRFSRGKLYWRTAKLCTIKIYHENYILYSVKSVIIICSETPLTHWHLGDAALILT